MKAIVQLQPKRPPGRADRKAAAFAAEIVRLRAGGYTYEAIREALAEVGIELSESALQREVRRQHKQAGCAVPGTRAPSARPDTGSPPMHQAPAIGAPTPPPPPPPPKNDTTGREIAEAFFAAHPSNPLLRSQEIP